jgi:DNA-binding response OmpR family regulator
MPTKGTVLIIEDDTAIRELLSIALELEGYHILTARNGLEGLQRAVAIRCDVIVLDLNMPVMDGKAFIEAYHRTVQPHAPILAASVRYTELRKLQGISGYFQKPYDLAGVVYTIDKVINASAGV